LHRLFLVGTQVQLAASLPMESTENALRCLSLTDLPNIATSFIKGENYCSCALRERIVAYR